MIGMYKFSYSVTAAPCAAREETKNVFFPKKACSDSARHFDQKALGTFVQRPVEKESVKIIQDERKRQRKDFSAEAKKEEPQASFLYQHHP
ncbi:hypothetical protein ALCH109712_06325 [Alkalicoccus chagannorensis]